MSFFYFFVIRIYNITVAMNKYRDKLADKIRAGYSCRTLFWSYFFILGIILAIILYAIYSQ